tara:strand:- start:4056 stop:4934 length:879 start_codon:yes stop_codon:yes gene_type:complete
MHINLSEHKAHIFNVNEIDISKKSIIFIPGAGMDHRTISMLNLSNLEDFYNIISVDLPGHGFTTGPLLKSIESYSLFCDELIEKLKLNDLTFIGHSMGGLVVLDLLTKHKDSSGILMNTVYPLIVGEQLLDHAKGNLDQACEFLTKYGIYNLPQYKIKTLGFGSMGSGSYRKSKGVIQSPYGTKYIIDDPEREIKLYPLKRLFNQSQKEILSIDLKACSSFKMKEKLIDGLNNIKLIYGDKDKLARFNPDNELLNNLDITSDVIILDETGHFPFFERPELTASTLNKLLLDC